MNWMNFFGGWNDFSKWKNNNIICNRFPSSYQFLWNKGQKILSWKQFMVFSILPKNYYPEHLLENTQDSDFLFVFWGELRTSQFAFEIYWPLVMQGFYTLPLTNWLGRKIKPNFVNKICSNYLAHSDFFSLN